MPGMKRAIHEREEVRKHYWNQGSHSNACIMSKRVLLMNTSMLGVFHLSRGEKLVIPGISHRTSLGGFKCVFIKKNTHGNSVHGQWSPYQKGNYLVHINTK